MSYKNSGQPWLTALLKTKSFYAQNFAPAKGKIRSRDEIVSLWLTICHSTFPASQNYKVDFHALGNTGAVLDLCEYRQLEKEIYGWFPLLQIVIVEQPENGRELTPNNFKNC